MGSVDATRTDVEHAAAHAVPEAARPGAVAAAALLALAVAMGIGRFAFTPILPMMQREVGLSLPAGAWLASANYAGYLLGALSAIALEMPAPLAIRAALVAIAATTLGMGLVQGVWPWAALRLLAGVGSAWVLVFASSWSFERLGAARRPALSGAVFAGVGTGIAIAGACCLALMRAGGSAAQAWIALGALAALATAAIWKTFGGSARTAPGIAASGGAGRHWWSAESARLVGCYGAFGFGYIIPATFLPVMARQAVRDPAVFGWAWPLFGAAAAVTPLAAAALARRFGYRRTWIASHIVMAAGVALPAWWASIASVMTAALLVGATFMVITQAGLQEARALAGPRSAPLMAALTSAFAVGQILGPLCAGYLVGAGGELGRPLLVASGVLLVSAWALGRGAR